MKYNLFEAWWSLIDRFRRSLVMGLPGTVSLVSGVGGVLLTGLQLERGDRRRMAPIETRLADIGCNRERLAEAPPPTSRRCLSNRRKRCITLGAAATCIK